MGGLAINIETQRKASHCLIFVKFIKEQKSKQNMTAAFGSMLKTKTSS